MAPVSLAVDRRGVATLRLERPDRLNALDAAAMDALTEAARTLAADHAARVVVIEGAGRGFCAGGDIGWMRGAFAADRGGKLAEGMRLARALEALDALPQTVIARIHGATVGAGVALACVADVVVAVEAARFGLTEARLGLLPAAIAPYVAARLAPGAARRFFATGGRFDAAEAQRLGLVHRLVPADALDAAVGAEIDAALACGPRAVAAAKAMLRRLARPVDPAETARLLADWWETEEPREGVAAFLDRRPPRWAQR